MLRASVPSRTVSIMPPYSSLLRPIQKTVGERDAVQQVTVNFEEGVNKPSYNKIRHRSCVEQILRTREPFRSWANVGRKQGKVLIERHWLWLLSCAKQADLELAAVASEQRVRTKSKLQELASLGRSLPYASIL